MKRAFHFAAALSLSAAILCADQPTKKIITPKAEKSLPGGGGTLGKVPGSNPQRVVNPANPVVMLFKASPQERERALEKLPGPMRKNFQKELDWFDKLSPADKAIQLRRAERWAQLTPEEQTVVKNEVAALNHLTQDRMRRVRVALLNLQKLPEDQRHKRMSNERWASQFSAEELRIITNLADAWFDGN